MEITGVEWTSLSEDFGFYTVSLDDVPPFDVKPFRNPTECNPFWAWEDSYIEKFIGDVVEDLMDGTPNIGRKNWGNYYNRLKHKTWKFSHLPHIDGPGMVGNLWMVDHEQHRSTRFFNFKDQWKDDRFTMLKDLMKPTCSQKGFLHELQNEIEYVWENFGIEYIESWGFEYLGEAPCKKNTITVYNSMMPHTAYIDETINECYSQLVKVATAPTHKE